jgi:SRSO17 transposase
VCLLSLSKGRWVAADSVYGSGAVAMALRRAGVGYVLGVTAKHQFCSWIGKPPVAGTAEAIAHELDPAAWQRLSAGAGTKGRGSMTGPIANWPISMRPKTTPTDPAYGRPAC